MGDKFPGRSASRHGRTLAPRAVSSGGCLRMLKAREVPAALAGVDGVGVAWPARWCWLMIQEDFSGPVAAESVAERGGQGERAFEWWITLSSFSKGMPPGERKRILLMAVNCSISERWEWTQMVMQRQKWAFCLFVGAGTVGIGECNETNTVFVTVFRILWMLFSRRDGLDFYRKYVSWPAPASKVWLFVTCVHQVEHLRSNTSSAFVIFATVTLETSQISRNLSPGDGVPWHSYFLSSASIALFIH